MQFGLIRNHYVGRTFIEPEQRVRDFGVKLKLNPVRHVLEGKRVVLIDDSIVRGTTSRKIVRMVRDAGAKEVHMRISCPPTISPCYYGVDTPSKNQFIAANKSVDEIREYIGADSLAYLSLEGLRKAAGEGDEPSTAPPAIPASIQPTLSKSKTSPRPWLRATDYPSTVRETMRAPASFTFAESMSRAVTLLGAHIPRRRACVSGCGESELRWFLTAP